MKCEGWLDEWIYRKGNAKTSETKTVKHHPKPGRGTRLKRGEYGDLTVFCKKV